MTDNFPNMLAFKIALRADGSFCAADMRVAVNATEPDRAFQSDEMPFMVETWLLAWDDVRHVVRIINIMAMAAFEDFLAYGHGGIFAL